MERENVQRLFDFISKDKPASMHQLISNLSCLSPEDLTITGRLLMETNEKISIGKIQGWGKNNLHLIGQNDSLSVSDKQKRNILIDAIVRAKLRMKNILTQNIEEDAEQLNELHK